MAYFSPAVLWVTAAFAGLIAALLFTVYMERWQERRARLNKTARQPTTMVEHRFGWPEERFVAQKGDRASPEN